VLKGGVSSVKAFHSSCTFTIQSAIVHDLH
jgi:hypothetical protein